MRRGLFMLEEIKISVKNVLPSLTDTLDVAFDYIPYFGRSW